MQRIGQSPLTLGRYGCTVTCIAMLTSYFFPTRTPKDLAESLQFTPDGLVLWGSCKFENFVFEKRVYLRDDAEIVRHIKDPNLAVILHVANRSHWVVATGISVLSGQIQIADPWFGDRASMARYGNDINGAAYFTRRA